jgi:hypothetical protein
MESMYVHPVVRKRLSARRIAKVSFAGDIVGDTAGGKNKTYLMITASIN